MGDPKQIDSAGTRGFIYDSLKPGLVVSDSLNYQVHIGRHYLGSDYDAALLAATPKNWMVQTGLEEVHLKYELNASNGGVLEIFEGSTTSDDGSTVPVFNNFRSSANVPLASFFVGPTITGDGTRIIVSSAGNDSNPVRISSTLDREREIILKVSTNYLFRYTPESNQRVG